MAARLSAFRRQRLYLYIAWSLRHAGFKVLYVSPNRLIISWQDQSIHYYQEESPIRQAMLAAAAASKETAVATAVGGGATRDRDAGKKRAASYKPTSEGVAGMLAGGAIPKKSGSSTITFI